MTSLDSLDQYMQGMKSGQEIDATTRRKMKMRTIELKKEIAKIEKMKEAAKPAEIKLKDPSKDSNGLTKSKSLFSGATSRFGFSIGASKLKQDVAKVSVNGNDGDNPATINEVNPLIAGAGGNSFKNADSEFVVKVSEKIDANLSFTFISVWYCSMNKVFNQKRLREKLFPAFHNFLRISAIFYISTSYS